MKQPLKHVLSAKQFDLAFLKRLCELTDNLRRYDKTKEGLLYLQSLLPHKRVMLFFTQPSTRTFLSFQSACYLLGMKPCEIRDPSTSSERKGETVEDSLRTFSSYVDLIVIRSPIKGLCDSTAALLDQTDRSVPVINAGSGPDEHPTQALLDIYTLERTFRKNGGLEGKTIAMVGDLKRGRTIRSLACLLSLFEGVKLVFVSPKEFQIEPDLRNLLNKRNVSFEETTHFEKTLRRVDALYMTRIQDEYDHFEGESKGIDTSSYSLRFEHLSLLKKDAVIMHPLPRRGELDSRIDTDPRAKYWRQERNGMWTRAALITILMGVDHLLVMPDL